MFGALESNALFQVAVAERLISSHEDLLSTHPEEMHGAIKLYAVASCVMRLYAIYERFVESLISDYLDLVPELTAFRDLPDGLKKEYRVGISHLLGKIDSERYSHLAHENVIRWYHEAVSDSQPYRFVVEALTRHEQNLRLDVVDNLMGRIGLASLRIWLGRTEHIGDLYEEQSSIVDQLESELRGFVQVRNDAAHGALSALQGRDNLLRYCELISALIRALTEFCYKCFLERQITTGRVRRIGTVSEVFHKAGAFILLLDPGEALAVGGVIHVVSQSHCRSGALESIMLNDQSVDRIVTAPRRVEVGVKCGVIPKKQASVYI